MAMTTITTTTAIMAIPLTVLHHGLRGSAMFFPGDRAVREDSRSWWRVTELDRRGTVCGVDVRSPVDS